MKILITLLFLTISTRCYSFNWDNCNRSMDEVGSTGLFLSSTQFVSSWGGCSMIGKIANDKKVFLAQNLDQIKTDSARGSGEYLEAYAHISRCDQSATSALPRLLQKNYEQIYGSDSQKKPRAIYESLENVIQSDPVTIRGCKIKS